MEDEVKAIGKFKIKKKKKKRVPKKGKRENTRYKY